MLERNGTNYLNEPYATGGNPILAGKDVLFNDMLGTTQGSISKNGKYQPSNTTAFGARDKSAFFTGKPYIEGLGSVFLYRNYRPELGKWQTSDPIGYPDGLNNLAYVNNRIISDIDTLGLCRPAYYCDVLTNCTNKIETAPGLWSCGGHGVVHDWGDETADIVSTGTWTFLTLTSTATCGGGAGPSVTNPSITLSLGFSFPSGASVSGSYTTGTITVQAPAFTCDLESHTITGTKTYQAKARPIVTKYTKYATGCDAVSIRYVKGTTSTQVLVSSEQCE